MTFKQAVRTMAPPMILSALSLLLLCIAYLPIKSNALITVDLTKANFSSLYPSKTVIGKTTEYIPGWINDTAWATFNSSDFEVRKKYHYQRYGYKENKTANVLGPELPELKLHDTNFCDEYSIGLWGYWANAKTNGVSYSVLQRDIVGSPLEDKIYLKPYALKNHTELKATANIWDIMSHRVMQSRYAYEGDVLDHWRTEIILLSFSLLVNVGLYALAPSPTGQVCKFRRFVFPVGCLVSWVLTLWTLIFSTAPLNTITQLEDGLATNANKFGTMGVTWRENHQARHLESATNGITGGNLFVTFFFGVLCML